MTNYDPEGKPHSLSFRGQVHCARGAKRCEMCRSLDALRAYTLYKPDWDHDGQSARPTMEFLVSGSLWFGKEPYHVVGTFSDEAGARAFALKHAACLHPIQHVPIRHLTPVKWLVLTV